MDCLQKQSDYGHKNASNSKIQRKKAEIFPTKYFENKSVRSRYSRRYIEKLLAYAEALSVGCGNAVTVHIVPPKYKKPTVYKFQNKWGEFADLENLKIDCKKSVRAASNKNPLAKEQLVDHAEELEKGEDARIEDKELDFQYVHEEKTDELKYENDFVKQELHDVPDRFENQDGDIDLRDDIKEELLEVPVEFEDEVDDPISTSRKRKHKKECQDVDEKKPKYDDVMYPCDQCNVSCTTESFLANHKESKHRIRPMKTYKCDQCDYSTNSTSGLNYHRKSKHFGIKFTCDVCGYTTTTKGHLKIHKESKHEDIL